jgi:hypothetical protein
MGLIHAMVVLSRAKINPYSDRAHSQKKPGLSTWPSKTINRYLGLAKASAAFATGAAAIVNTVREALSPLSNTIDKPSKSAADLPLPAGPCISGKAPQTHAARRFASRPVW